MLSEAMKDNLTQRFDSDYFKKEFLLDQKSLEKIKYARLGEVAVIRGGKRIPIDYSFSQSGIPYIRAEDVKDFVEWKNSPKIAEDLHKLLFRYQTKHNDVLLTIVGTVGSIGIVKFNLEKCNLTENCVRLVSSKNLPEYLFCYLKSKYGQKIIEREKVGTVQEKLSIERINRIKVPNASFNFQEKIKNLVDHSFYSLEQFKLLYSEAENLLLESLGLNNPSPNASHSTLPQGAECRFATQNGERSSFGVVNPDEADKFSHLSINQKSFKESFLKTGRLDAEYYQPKYEKIINQIQSAEYAKLCDLVLIQKSIEPGSEAYLESGLEFIRVANLSKFGISKSEIFLDEKKYSGIIKPKKDTILLSKDGTVGIAYKVSEDLNCITSGAILHLTINQTNILPDYLTLVLNSKLVQMQAERDSGGSIIQHWKSSEIMEILIPIIDQKTQSQISSLIQESFTLKSKSEKLLELAKQAVEMAIEESEEKALNFIDKENFIINFKKGSNSNDS